MDRFGISQRFGVSRSFCSWLVPSTRAVAKDKRRQHNDIVELLRLVRKVSVYVSLPTCPDNIDKSLDQANPERAFGRPRKLERFGTVPPPNR